MNCSNCPAALEPDAPVLSLVLLPHLLSKFSQSSPKLKFQLKLFYMHMHCCHVETLLDGKNLTTI